MLHLLRKMSEISCPGIDQTSPQAVFSQPNIEVCWDNGGTEAALENVRTPHRWNSNPHFCEAAVLLLPLHLYVAQHLNIVRSFLVSRFGIMRETSRPRRFLPQNAVKLPLRATAHVVSWKSENRSFISVTSRRVVVQRGFLVNRLHCKCQNPQGRSISGDADLPPLGFHLTNNNWCYSLWGACCEIQLEQLLLTQLGL